MRASGATWRAKLQWSRWVCFSVMCLAFLLVMVTRFGPAVIATDLTREFALDPTQLGLLSAVYFWVYAGMQIPAGALADGLGPRRAVAGLLVVAMVGAFAFASSSMFPVALAGRAVMGVGTGVVYVCALKVLAQWFRADEFATLNGVLFTAGNTGALLAAAPLALLVDAIGWRSGFGLLAALAGLVALLAALLVRDAPAEAASNARTGGGDGRQEVASAEIALTGKMGLVLRSRGLWVMAVYAFTLGGVALALQGLWAVPYLMDVYALPRQVASNMLTAWPVGMIIGCPLVGYLSDRVLKTRQPIVFCGVALFSLPILVLVVATSDLPTGLFYGLFFFCGLTYSTMQVSFALLNDVLPRHIVGTAAGIYNLWFFVGGAVFQQTAGIVLSAFPILDGHASASGYRAVFLLFLAGAWVAALTVLVTRKKVISSLGQVDPEHVL